MERNQKTVAFFRYGVPMFVIGYGVAVLLFNSNLGDWEAKYGLYVVIAILAISTFAQWFFSRRSAK